ncbi:MAG: Rrf2 family transcriptional regulator [bacterium]|nr:Rrf2 family transcriptional regulator [bacterium]
MLNITKQSDYGILFVSYLYSRKEKFVPLSDLIRDTQLPNRFMARIAASLVRNKIIESKEGKVGGYKVSKKIDSISLYDFLKIFEGDLALTKCSIDPDYRCKWYESCMHKSFLRHTLTNLISKDLKKWKLVDVFKT